LARAKKYIGEKMIKIAGNETLYSASLILLVGETAVVTPAELPGSVIEISVKDGKSDEPALAAGIGLNEAKLTVETGYGTTKAFFRLHTPDLRILDGRIVTQTLGNMTRADIQISDSGLRIN
jgi:hypothetical protein